MRSTRARSESEDFVLRRRESRPLPPGRCDIGALVDLYRPVPRRGRPFWRRSSSSIIPAMAEEGDRRRVVEEASALAVAAMTSSIAMGGSGRASRSFSSSRASWHRQRSFLRRGISDGFSEDARAVLETSEAGRWNLGRLGRAPRMKTRMRPALDRFDKRRKRRFRLESLLALRPGGGRMAKRKARCCGGVAAPGQGLPDWGI